MQKHRDHDQRETGKSVAVAFSATGAGNRPAPMAGKWQEIVDNSPQVRQFKVYQEMADSCHHSAAVSGTRVVQRLGANVGASSAALVAEYNNLLLSATFQDLNVKATTTQNIILTDSSLVAGQPTDYNAATHTIRVPLNTAAGVARPLADVRDDIMWEMHNATTKGATNRTNDKLRGPAPGPGASMAEKKEYPYKIAAGALSHEWEEWILVVEHDLRVQKINADPAMAGLGAGPHVTRAYGGNFGVADAGWFKFTNYLQVQMNGGHTAAYDPAAALPGWKGKDLLSIVKYSSEATLKITEKQVTDWNSGKTKNVKSIDNNPFNKLSLVKDAMGR